MRRAKQLHLPLKGTGDGIAQYSSVTPTGVLRLISMGVEWRLFVKKQSEVCVSFLGLGLSFCSVATRHLADWTSRHCAKRNKQTVQNVSPISKEGGQRRAQVVHYLPIKTTRSMSSEAGMFSYCFWT